MVSQYRSIVVLLTALAAACSESVAPDVGSLHVEVTGLPAGGNALVRVNGPNQFIQIVRASLTIGNLHPGRYVVSRDTVVISGTRFAAGPADTVSVTRGTTQSVTAAYQIASGSLTVNINGLPDGIPADLHVRGPLPPQIQAINELVPVSGTLAGLRPGDYEVRADPMTAFTGDKFASTQVFQIVTVPASVTPVVAGVTYVLASGSLSLTVNGLPTSSTTQAIQVTGPSGYDARTAQSTTLRGLAAGTYTIAAANVAGTCPDIFTTNDSQQSRDVTIGNTSSATINYTASQASADLNLKIDNVYLTQATQNSAGTVPLIAGKPALVRVFGSGTPCNSATPKVRVTLSTGSVFVIDAPESSVRTQPDEGTLASSWNVVVPGSAVQPGMTIVAEMDATSQFAETNESDNRFPAVGAKALDVRTVPVIGLRIVPITQSVNNLTGGVTAANLNEYLAQSLKMHPVATYDVDIRPYTTSLGALGATNQSNWNQVLGEILNLRTIDQSSRYYYGVAKVTYTSGIAGVAYVPGKAGMGWDILPSASRVMAHELGHSYGRLHSPCGDPDGVDVSYPSTGNYSGGRIGVHGWDPVEGFKSAPAFTDIMGYCSSQWISDYTYVGMLDWLTNPHNGPTLPAISGAEQPSLLIWGRIDNGQPVLEPTFEISARPTAMAPGPHRIAALDERGVELFSMSFAGQRVADVPGDYEAFSFTVPVSALRGRTLASLKLTARGKTVSNVASSDVAADPDVAVTRVGTARARVRWNAARFPVVMVRDPVGGHVLSFARGGDITIATPRTELELNFSNRLRSSRRLSRLR